MARQKQDETLDYFIGEVAATFFTNPNNYYRVVKVHIDETNTLYSEPDIVMTGTFFELNEGTSYQFYGKIVDHPKYGIQFAVHHYQPIKATTKEGLVKYLSGSDFPGIGQVLAQRIVDRLGNDAIDKIMHDDEALAGIRGLTKKKRLLLVETVKKNEGNQAVQLRLAELGLSSQLSAQVYAKYGAEALAIISENPYALIQDFRGFGFTKADQLAERLGFAMDSPIRIKGALVYCLSEDCYGNGDTYMARDALVQAAWDVLTRRGQAMDLATNLVYAALDELNEAGDVVITDERVAPFGLYHDEAGIARYLYQTLAQTETAETYDGETLNREIQRLENEQGIQYGHAQRLAIKEALQSNVYILTGGPGTGKTTVVNAIVKIYAHLHDLSLSDAVNDPDEFPILMAAPTGRAAKRMTELTGLPASTIHRLLGLTGDDFEGDEPENQEDERIKSHVLDGTLLIIDEMSMIDTGLCYQLMAAIPPGMQVIFVGDQDQLPSVGPGQVLYDLLRSKLLPSRELDEIFRQDDDSTIVYLAHAIKAGRVPSSLVEKQRDRSFLRAHAAQIPTLVAKVAARALEKGYAPRDVQVLAPMYKGEAGIDHLNAVLQETLNPEQAGRRDVSYFDQVFRVHDKVLQLKNNPEQGVFNGDLGEIVAIFYAKETESKMDEIVVAFEDTEVTYVRNNWDQLTLAYCISIHKAQGSEFPIVILPLVHQFNRMLQRNLLYTAITRTKQALVLCGEPNTFAQAIYHTADQRKTQLYDQLLTLAAHDSGQAPVKAVNSSEYVVTEHPEKHILTPALVNAEAIDPLIGMDGISPYNL